MIEACAELVDDVLGSEVAAGSLRPREEKLPRIARGERRYRVSVLAGQLEQLPAGSENLQAGTGAEQA